MAESERQGGEGGHGAAKPDRVIHGYVFYHPASSFLSFVVLV
jgi:hypothetical protein